MKAAWYERRGPAAEVLTVGEIAAPEPGPGEVRVRVALSGINPGDTKKRGDWLGQAVELPDVVSDELGEADASADPPRDPRLRGASSSGAGRRRPLRATEDRRAPRAPIARAR